MVNSPSHGIFSCVVWLTVVMSGVKKMVVDYWVGLEEGINPTSTIFHIPPLLPNDQADTNKKETDVGLHVGGLRSYSSLVRGSSYATCWKKSDAFSVDGRMV